MSAARNGTPARILIVEDSHLVADAVADCVRQRGYAVGAAVASLEQSLNLVANRVFEAAIVDIDLAGKLAFPVCRALKSKRIPFLFMTGSDSIVVPAEFGTTPRLNKPFATSELASALDRLLESRHLPSRFGNAILDALDRESQESLVPLLELVELSCGNILDAAGNPVTHVYFPVDSLISMFTTGASVRRIEVVGIGSDNMTAPALLLGCSNAIGDTVVQTAGRAWRVGADSLRQIANGNAGIRCHMLACIGEMLQLISHNIWYTGHATIEGRLARWLLQTTNRLDSDTVFITHEKLSDILGVRRSGITTALSELEGRGLVRAFRRTIVVGDRPGLSAESRRHREARH